MEEQKLVSGEKSFLILGVQHGFLSPKQALKIEQQRRGQSPSERAHDVSVISRKLGILNAESAFKILRLRARHGRSCKGCDLLTFLLPKQRSLQTRCEHCDGALAAVEGKAIRGAARRTRPLGPAPTNARRLRKGPQAQALVEGGVFQQRDLGEKKQLDSEVFSFLGMRTLIEEGDSGQAPEAQSGGLVTESLAKRQAKLGEVLSPDDLKQAEAIIGRTLDGCFIKELIYGGGMGNVFLGFHTMLEQKRVFKTLKPQFLDQEKMRARFVREARLAARLDHPNVVPVINLAEIDEGQIVYLTMPFIEGRDLQKIIAKIGPLEQRWLLQIAKGLTSALAYAHKLGMVHRDVKPANVIIDNNGRLRLTDFGLAKMLNDTKLTAAGAMIGTPLFMAPEANRPGSDFRVDIYSLGLTLYFCATARHPLKGARLGDLLRGHVHNRIADPRTLSANLTPGFCQMLAKSLAPDPGQRYESMEQFRQAVKNLLCERAPLRAFDWPFESEKR
jgi:tRNA A-37 threonylcarbamoyl transferase component Bud32